MAQPGVELVEEEHLPRKKDANPMLRRRMAQPEVERGEGGGHPRTVRVDKRLNGCMSVSTEADAGNGVEVLRI